MKLFCNSSLLKESGKWLVKARCQDGSSIVAFSDVAIDGLIEKAVLTSSYNSEKKSSILNIAVNDDSIWETAVKPARTR